MFCEACGATCRPGIKFCESCGNALSSQCPACGTSGPASRKFCGECGTSMAVQQPVTDSPAATDAQEISELAARSTASSAFNAGGERRHLTVMFCDLVGSTAMSQVLDPEDLSALIQEYSERASAIIHESGGYVARYMGDGILSYFGYPKAYEDNAARSVRAAMELIRETRKIITPDGIEFKTRVGIASGETITGHTVEADAGIETLAIGRTPNLAARLQGLAEPDAVVISDSTYRRLRGEWACESLGPQQLKGFDTPELAWRVGEPATSSRSPSFADTTSRIVHRDDEISLLENRWQRTVSGNGQLVHVCGEPGIGKSTLAHEFTTARAGDATIISLQCRTVQSSRAFGPVISHFQTLTDHTTTGEQKNIRETLKLNLPRSMGDDAEAIDILENLVLSRHDGTGSLSAVDRRSAVLTTLTNWIAGLSESRPVLLFIEDLHWSDPSTLDWIDGLVTASTSRRLMLLLTSRTDFQPSWDDEQNTHTMNLGRLPRDGIEDIVTMLGNGHALPPAIVQLIIDRTDGIPLFVEELTREVLASESLQFDGNRWLLQGSIDSLGVPDSLQDLLMARLDRSPEIRNVVQVAAVFGREFESPSLARVSGQAEPDIQVALTDLDRAKLVRRRRAAADDTWFFRHALVRDAAYHSLLKSRRRELHDKTAQALMRADPQLIHNQPELIAWHTSRAERFDKSRAFWIQAAENARSTWANNEAADYYTHALEDNSRLDASRDRDETELDCLLGLGETLRSAKGSSARETRDAFTRAAALATVIGDSTRQIPSLYGLFVSNFTAAKLDAADMACRQMIEVAEQANHPDARIAANQASGMHAFARGDFSTARELFYRALGERTDELQSVAAIQFPVTTQSYLCWTLQMLGESDAALELLTDALDAARDGPSYDYALLLGNGCYLFQMRNESEAVGDLAETLSNLSVKRHLDSWFAVAEFFKAWAACNMTPSADEVQWLTDALDAWAEDEIETPYFKCLVAERLLAAGQRSEARDMVNDALRLMQSTGELWYQSDANELLQSISGSNEHDPSAEPETA